MRQAQRNAAAAVSKRACISATPPPISGAIRNATTRCRRRHSATGHARAVLCSGVHCALCRHADRNSWSGLGCVCGVLTCASLRCRFELRTLACYLHIYSISCSVGEMYSHFTESCNILEYLYVASLEYAADEINTNSPACHCTLLHACLTELRTSLRINNPCDVCARRLICNPYFCYA